MDTHKNGDLTRDGVIGKSIYHSLFTNIKVISELDKLELDNDGRNLTKNRSSKAKGPTLNEKVSAADIKEWKDHRYILLSFLFYMKSNFLVSQEVKNTLPNFPLIPENEQFLREDQSEYKDMSQEKKEKLKETGIEQWNAYKENGLSNREVEERQKKYGKNKLPEKKKTHWIILIFNEMTNLFANLLWAAAALAFLGYGLDTSDTSNLYLAIVICSVVIITGFFSYYQNSKSDAIMDSFKGYQDAKVTVRRNKEKIQEEKEIPSEELVVGDVVKVKMGDKIPADIRIIDSINMKVDNAPLTGESEHVVIDGTCGEDGFKDPKESKNTIFFSTLCTVGEGWGIVIKIGSNTFMGKIADLASSAQSNETPIQREIMYFIKLIAVVAVSIGIVFFFLGFIVKYPIIVNFIFSIGLIVANVPEGLLSSFTICMAITAKKMYNKKMLVKNMQSVETLGSISCICSDKTGTLTYGKMKVVHLWYDGQIKYTKNVQPIIDGNEKVLYNKNDLSFPYLKFSAVCASDGRFSKEVPEDYQEFVEQYKKYKNENKKSTQIEDDLKKAEIKMSLQQKYEEYYSKFIEDRKMPKTDSTESAILKFFEISGNIEEVRDKYPLLNNNSKIPFNSSIKCTVYVRKNYIDDKNLNYTLRVAVKGAGERIIDMCDKYLFNGKIYQMDESYKNKIKQGNHKFALMGERVIGLAFLDLDPLKYHNDYKFYSEMKEEIENGNKISILHTNIPKENLVFSGLVAIEDPPREGVKEAIDICHKAKIKVIMVTGDQMLTAASIAHQIGIIKDINQVPILIKEKNKLKTLEDAEKQSNTIVIEGHRLAEKLRVDENLSDENPKKGEFLRSALLKECVVFARTSPEQKLIIVDGCQKLSHCVAVTGDGVNDSPAIKKADIGIAMGKIGTEVAKDAADIVLIDDDFSNIVKGIKQGRNIFDILKRIIGYNLTSNIPEVLPFIGLVVFQFPLPLTTILILCIDVGTDVYPNITFSFEVAEKSIMLRPPRNVKTERLCNLKLFGWAYLFNGVIQNMACFLSYFVIMNDYGFRPGSLFFFVLKEAYIPSASDFFNPYDEYKGNSVAFLSFNSELIGLRDQTKQVLVESRKSTISWSNDAHINIDQRIAFYDESNDFWGDCVYDSRGMEYDGPVCYRVEALRHAQGGFLTAIIVTQITNALNWRTKITSVYQHKLTNMALNYCFFIEFILINVLLYVPGINTAFAIRPLKIEHFLPSAGLTIVWYFYVEFTKYLIRTIKEPDGSPGFFYRAFFY